MSMLVEDRESRLLNLWDSHFGKPGRALGAELRYRHGVHLDDLEAILVACKERPPSAPLRAWAFGCKKNLPARRADGTLAS